MIKQRFPIAVLPSGMGDRPRVRFCEVARMATLR